MQVNAVSHVLGALRSTVHCTGNLHYIYGSLIFFILLLGDLEYIIRADRRIFLGGNKMNFIQTLCTHSHTLSHTVYLIS